MRGKSSVFLLFRHDARALELSTPIKAGKFKSKPSGARLAKGFLSGRGWARGRDICSA